MKVLIISDSHGHLANLKSLIDIAIKGKMDAIIHAGDWNTTDSVECVLGSLLPLYAVLGNADIDPMVGKKLRKESKNFSEDFLIVEIGGKKIGITHKPSNNNKYFQNINLDLIINGHLHSRYESVQTPVKIVRPGATVNGINFAVYDTNTGKVEFIGENV